jgi:multiple sugar transport system substrate-binding protein
MQAAIITAREAAKQAAAWDSLKFVTGPEVPKIVVETTGYMPTNIHAVEKEFLGSFDDANPNFRTVFTQVDRARPRQGPRSGRERCSSIPAG